MRSPPPSPHRERGLSKARPVRVGPALPPSKKAPATPPPPMGALMRERSKNGWRLVEERRGHTACHPPPQHARTRSRRHGRSTVSCPCCARRRACGGGAVPLPPPPVVASGGAAAVAQVAPPRQVHRVSALARWRRTRWMAREIVTGDSVGRGAALTWADGQPMGLGPAP